MPINSVFQFLYWYKKYRVLVFLLDKSSIENKVLKFIMLLLRL